MPISNTAMATISALVTGIVLVPATYTINDYLARDRISLEAVEIVPTTTLFKPDSQKLQRLAAAGNSSLQSLPFPSDFQNWLSTQPPAVRGLLWNSSLNGHDTAVLRDAMASYVEYLDGRLKTAQDLKSRWLKLRDYKKADRLEVIDLLSDMVVDRVIVLMEDPGQLLPSIDKVDSSLANKILQLQTDRQIASEIGKDAQDFHEQRTGDIDVHATFLNSGNTDGLVKSYGTVELAERPVTVPIVECLGRAVRVEKRSVQEAWFKLDEVAAVRGQLDDLKTIVKDGSSLSGTIDVKDFRGSSIRSAKVPFPLGLVPSRGGDPCTQPLVQPQTASYVAGPFAP